VEKLKATIETLKSENFEIKGGKTSESRTT
jgi:hypothetical protein